MTPHMYPETLEGTDVRSQAEVRLFKGFQEQLSDDFYVFGFLAEGCEP